MDIDLLAKMVKEAVMDHDSVTLPGMGSFVAELVPAQFADRGYTILPPYRRLYFSPKQGDDTYLAELYARSNGASQADANRILVDFLAEMKEVLKQRKSLQLTGLGRLRATRENHFFFVADEDLDIYPAGFGLQPISLKTHEETPEEVAAAVSNLADILESQPEPVVEPEPSVIAEEEPAVIAEEGISSDADEKADASEDVPPSVEETVPEETVPEETVPEETVSEEPAPVAEEEPVIEEPAVEKPVSQTWKTVGWVLLGILIAAVVAALVLAIVGRVAPEWLDSFLYSPEELEILHK